LNKVQTPESGRREHLLEIGRRLFSERPYDELSIDVLAREAGISKGLLYYYFGSKRGYYLAVIEAAAAELRALASPDEGLSPDERIRRTLDAYIASAERYPDVFRAVTHAGVGADTEVRAIHDRERAALLELIAGETVGSPPPPAARTALEGWLSFVEGATLDWLVHRDLSGEQLRDLLVEALAGSLAAAHAAVRHNPGKRDRAEHDEERPWPRSRQGGRPAAG
jgi:AcrR family transcriptional regulator